MTFVTLLGDGQIIGAAGGKYHANCFKCVDCGMWFWFKLWIISF